MPSRTRRNTRVKNSGKLSREKGVHDVLSKQGEKPGASTAITGLDERGDGNVENENDVADHHDAGELNGQETAENSVPMAASTAAMVTTETAEGVESYGVGTKADNAIHRPRPDEVCTDQDVKITQEKEENRPRLMIDCLKLENFKSYGGIVEVGPFHKRFSAIVGPNGSGKSNVIDAMLFVFGRRAKQLRHSKLKELLHHSEKYPNVTQASVTVYFKEIIDTGDGDLDYEVVENSGFAVTRTAFSSNTSKYYINEREVKMSQVAALLKSKGVDLDNNRFLILQGEVEQIAMLKPKATNAQEDGLLEYLEDIIGSNKYVADIEQSMEQVENLQTERSHKLQRVKAAEAECDNLGSAKNDAEAFLEKERSLLNKRIKLSNAAVSAQTKELSEVEERKSSLEEKQKADRALLDGASEQLKALENKYTAHKREYDEFSKGLKKAKSDFASFERRDIQLREEVKALKAREKKLRKTHAAELARVEELEGEIRIQQTRKVKAGKQVDEAEKSLAASQKKLEQLYDKTRHKTEPIRLKLEEKQKEMMPFSDVVNRCTQELEIAKTELEMLTKDADKPKTALEEAKQSLETTVSDLDRANREKSSLSRQKEDLQSQINRKKASLEDLIADRDQTDKQVQEARTKLESAKSSENEVASRDKLHLALKAAESAGEIPGIVGRLRDLGAIDEKYDSAVGAAAGGVLNYIVVRETKDAQACVEYMRRKNLGRTTFIILEKLQYLHANMDQTSTIGQRLFDLVRVNDDEHRAAFYFALRETFVCDTLDEATRLAFQPTRRNRVVTIDGNLIDKSGAMTGGGRSRPRAGLSSTVPTESEIDPRTIQALEHKVKTGVERSKILNREVEELKTSVKQAIAELHETTNKLTKLDQDIHYLKKSIDAMEKETIPALERAVRASKEKKNDGNVKKARKNYATKEVALHSAKEDCKALEVSIAKLQESIIAAGGKELSSTQKLVEQERDNVSKLKSEVSKADSRGMTSEKAKIKAEKAAEDAERECEKVQNELKLKKDKFKELEEKAVRVQEKCEEHENLMREKQQILESIQEESSTLKEKLKKARHQEIELVEKIEEVNREVNAIRKSLEVSQKVAEKAQRRLRRNAKEAEGIEEDKDIIEEPETKSTTENVEEREDVSDKNEVELSEKEMKKLKMEIAVLEGELAALSPNRTAIKEYRRKEMEYRAQVEELDDLTSKRDAARRKNDSLRKTRLEEFMVGFSTITLKLKELYQMITLGGDAELELVDSLDPFSEGIVFAVRPPKKSWKNISNLSGGEKTLSSLALVFALHHFKPTPLYFLDEIDAALDFKNVSIVANYVKERTKNAQFIIISLRNNMFELADRLVGIFKTENTTKSVSVTPRDFVIPNPNKMVAV